MCVCVCVCVCVHSKKCIMCFYKILATVPYAEGQLQLSYPAPDILKFIQ